MNPAISNIGWRACDDEQAFGLMASAGCHCLEVAPGRLFQDPGRATRSDAILVRKGWEGFGIAAVAMQSLLFGKPHLTLFGGAAARMELLDHLGRMADLAAWLGCRALVLGSPSNRRRGDMSLADAVVDSIPFFEAAAVRVGGAGCVLCLEPNARAYGCDFLNTVPETLDVVRLVGHPALRLQVDAGSLSLEGESLPALDPDLVGHVHLSEPHLAPLGTAGADLAGVLSALRGSGYAGLVSVEMRETGDSSLANVASALRLSRSIVAGPAAGGSA